MGQTERIDYVALSEEMSPPGREHEPDELDDYFAAQRQYRADVAAKLQEVADGDETDPRWKAWCAENQKWIEAVQAQ